MVQPLGYSSERYYLCFWKALMKIALQINTHPRLSSRNSSCHSKIQKQNMRVTKACRTQRESCAWKKNISKFVSSPKAAQDWWENFTYYCWEPVWICEYEYTDKLKTSRQSEDLESKQSPGKCLHLAVVVNWNWTASSEQHKKNAPSATSVQQFDHRTEEQCPQAYITVVGGHLLTNRG